MRLKFDEQLALLNEELITMGALCENAIATSSKALTSGDFELAAGVRVLSEQINQKKKIFRISASSFCFSSSPVAKDLRAISSALKMITDMERIGDQSADIAEIITTAHISASGDTFNISDMAQAAIKMVTESIDAFVKKDIDIARSPIHSVFDSSAGAERRKTALIREIISIIPKGIL